AAIRLPRRAGGSPSTSRRPRGRWPAGASPRTARTARMAEFEPVLTARWGMDAPVWIDEYERSGGYGALRKALRMDPDEIIEEVKVSGLRGRGGAGFP